MPLVLDTRYRLAVFEFVLLLCLWAGGVCAVPVNQTFDDDASGTGQTSITYSIADAWTTGQNCPGCHAQPDKSQVHDGTWHDSTHDTDYDKVPTTATFRFTGTAIYIYCVIANQVVAPNGGQTGTKADYSFTLDGSDVGHRYTHNPENTEDYYYNVPVLSLAGLDNTDHEVVMNLNGGEGVAGSVLALVDYFVYTFDDGTSPTTNNPPPPTPTPTSPSPSPNPSPTATTPDNARTDGTSSIASSTSSTTPGISLSSQLSTGTAAAASITTNPSTFATSGPASPTSSSVPGQESATGTPGADASGASSHSKPPIGLIVGCAIAGALVIICSLLALWCWRRKRRTSKASVVTATPRFTTPATSQSVLGFASTSASLPAEQPPPLPSQPAAASEALYRDVKGRYYSSDIPPAPVSSSGGARSETSGPTSTWSSSARTENMNNLQAEIDALRRELNDIRIAPPEYTA